MEFYEVEKLLERHPKKHFGIGASSEDIEQAQQQLKAHFPNDYIAFMRKFGWGGVAHWEIYGLGVDVPIYLDLVRVTRSERTEMLPHLPLYLIPIYNDGGGNLYCLNCRNLENGRCPMVFWDHDLDDNQQLDVVANDFATWLYEQLESA